ncbi:MAG TPA: dihydrodipicolinate synthase family protein, partial [Anaeromyxobacteraceae bacterium]|nr:dihydrodipicolinate synthase family protein [Anaeromyxobacteraceae bacterium]
NMSLAVSGVFCAAVTPFNADLSPDHGLAADHARALLADGCHGIALLGTTGEANSLSVGERMGLLEAMLRGGVAPEQLLPGTGVTAIPETVELTRHALDNGVNRVVMLPPFYYKGVSDDGLFRSYAELVERVGDDRLRVYLYHIPPMAQVGISPALVERLLAAYPRSIAGMKDSSGDMANTRTMLERFAARGFDVFPGSERFLLEGMRGGGAGCISATANVNAAAMDRLFRAWREPGAERLQEELNGIRSVVERLPAVPALKAIVAHHAGDPGWATVRPPLVELDAPRREALLGELSGRGFSMAGL